ncbi:hypothetical protein PPACK8108_LOCUS19398 [Phakopsora pachyrhizi]|uniref:Uncharacterized protein n=1 Tax=Phakopsora pachyrhizi TaxID=170000 RepID=A0AAV0BFZ1_PHAPC|nr:hypothetical protein PPACK8108_LOCUS19398 [Phakopsora pachyrhizi]
MERGISSAVDSTDYQLLPPHEPDAISGFYDLDSNFIEDIEVKGQGKKNIFTRLSHFFLGNKLRIIICWSFVLLLIIFHEVFGVEPIDCKKTLMFNFLYGGGFFSEVLIFTRFASKARSLGYTILFNDQGWNYGKVKDYFDYDNPKCASSPALLNITRDNFCTKVQVGKLLPICSLSNSDHVVVDRNFYPEFDSFLRSEIDPEYEKLESTWAFLNQRKELLTLPFNQNLNHKIKHYFDGQSRELKLLWRPNHHVLNMTATLDKDLRPKLKTKSSFISRFLPNLKESKILSVHYRLGDKVIEIKPNDMSSEPFGILSAFNKSGRYIRKAISMASRNGWNLSPESLNLVTISDDIPTAIHQMKEYQNSFADQLSLNIVAPTPNIYSNLGGAESRNTNLFHGHSQGSYDHVPIEDRIKLGRIFLAEIEWVRRHSDGLICSASSNVCSGLMLLLGSDRVIDDPVNNRISTVASVDLRWVPTALPIIPKMFPSIEAIKLAQELSMDPQNFIDFSHDFRIEN